MEPYGESRRSDIAFQIAVLEAITTIRDVKAKELVGTVFTAIRLGDREERWSRDHLAFMLKESELAARYLDRCASLLDISYSLHGNMVNELEHLLDDHDSLKVYALGLAAHVVGSSEETIENGVVPTLETEPIYSPATPPYSPIPTEGYRFVNGWEVPITHEQIVSTGWGRMRKIYLLPM